MRWHCSETRSWCTRRIEVESARGVSSRRVLCFLLSGRYRPSRLRPRSQLGRSRPTSIWSTSELGRSSSEVDRTSPSRSSFGPHFAEEVHIWSNQLRTSREADGTRSAVEGPSNGAKHAPKRSLERSRSSGLRNAPSRLWACSPGACVRWATHRGRLPASHTTPCGRNPIELVQISSRHTQIGSNKLQIWSKPSKYIVEAVWIVVRVVSGMAEHPHAHTRQHRTVS